MSDINVTIADATPISVSLNDSAISVSISGTVGTYVYSDNAFYLDGPGGNIYWIHDSATDQVQLWMNGVKVTQFTSSSSGGNPFA